MSGTSSAAVARPQLASQHSAVTAENLLGAHRFLPSTLLEQLARCHPGKAAESKENLSAAFVHLDVCGLHELADELDSKEEDATLAAQRREQVVGVLESWYAHVAAVVAAHGGDVVKFTGDSLLILWPFARAAGSDEAARRAVVAAARCALALLRTNSAVVWENGAPPAELVWDVASARERRRGAAVDAAALAAAAAAAAGSSATSMSAAAAETARLATEAEWERKLERLRRFRDGSGPEPLNQGSVMLLKGGQADGALDILGNDALGDRVEMREMPARLLTATAGVGVGELFALHVGSPQRYEYVVWGDSLQQTARAAFCHAQPGECLASQEVFALAGEDLRLEPKQAVAGVVYDAARQKELEAVLLLKGVKPAASSTRAPRPRALTRSSTAASAARRRRRRRDRSSA